MKKIAFISVCSLILFAACFSPYTGDESVITINFGSSALAVYPLTPGESIDEFLPYLDHQITLTGPTGTHKYTRKGSSVKLYVAPGSWEVQVTDTCGGIPFASSAVETIDVKRGENNAVSIKMNPDGTTTFHTVKSETEWTALSLVGDNCIILTESFSTGASVAFGGATVTIIGNGKTITYDMTGYCFNLASGISVTIKDVHLKGNSSNTSPLVNINGGSFTMDSGRIYGNGELGVRVFGGSFTMNGGTISGNNNNGVNVDGGRFTMNNGTISGNTLLGVQINDSGAEFIMEGGTISGNSGGVGIIAGTFTMKNGTISGNTNNTNGGGVNISNNGTFNMEGGTITKNTANLNGGGVYVEGTAGVAATFIMTRGTISGNTAGSGKSLYVGDNATATIGSDTYNIAGTTIETNISR